MSAQTLDLLVIGCIGIAYLIIWDGIIRRNQNKNFWTFILWTLLNALATFATERIGGDVTLTATFLIGALATSMILMFRGKTRFGRVELATTALVVSVFVVSRFASPNIVIWANAAAIFVAGIPYGLYLHRNKIDAYEKASLFLFLTAEIFSLTSNIRSQVSEVISTVVLVYWAIAVIVAFLEKPVKTIALDEYEKMDWV